MKDLSHLSLSLNEDGAHRVTDKITGDFCDISIDRASCTLFCPSYSLVKDDRFDKLQPLIAPEEVFERISFSRRILNLQSFLEGVFDEKGLFFENMKGVNYRYAYVVKSSENDTDSLRIDYGSISHMAPVGGVRLQWNKNKLDIMDDKYNWIIPFFYSISTVRQHSQEHYMRAFIKWTGIDIAVDYLRRMHSNLWSGTSKDGKSLTKENRLTWLQFGDRGSPRYYRLYDKYEEIKSQIMNGKNVTFPSHISKELERRDNDGDETRLNWWRVEVTKKLGKNKVYFDQYNKVWEVLKGKAPKHIDDIDERKMVDDNPFKGFTYKHEFINDPLEVWRQTKDRQMLEVCLVAKMVPKLNIKQVPYFMLDEGMVSVFKRKQLTKKIKDSVLSFDFRLQPEDVFEVAKEDLLGSFFNPIIDDLKTMLDGGKSFSFVQKIYDAGSIHDCWDDQEEYFALGGRVSDSGGSRDEWVNHVFGETEEEREKRFQERLNLIRLQGDSDSKLLSNFENEDSDSFETIEHHLSIDERFGTEEDEL